MENGEKVICRAEIKSGLALRAIALWFAWWIVVGAGYYAAGPMLHCKKATGTFEEKYIWGMVYYEMEIVPSYPLPPGTEKREEYYNGRFALGIAITVLLVILPLAIFLVKKAAAKRCELVLTEKEVSGQLKSVFGKRKLQIPIERLCGVTSANGFMDKVRGGETLFIRSDSEYIRIRYVQNADEFAREAMKLIGEAKGKAPAAQPAAAPAPAHTVSGGDAMEKIGSLKQMLDSGLISREEFDAKKADILSKM